MDERPLDREEIATRTLLLQEHQTQLREKSTNCYFHRGAFLAVACVVFAVPLSNTPRILLSIGAVLLGLSWFLEGFSIRRRLHYISNSLAKSEEGKHHLYWEDAFIKYEYRVTGQWIAQFIHYFKALEPVIWVIVAIFFIYFEKKVSG